MSGTGDDEPRTYEVVLTEPAEAAIESIFLYLTGRSPDVAGRWLRGLHEGINRLSFFPYRNAEMAERPGIRRLLYDKYLILYRIREPGDPAEDGQVQVLHVYHGSQQV